MAGLIGIATWNYREGSLASRIERFAGFGYNAVSLAGGDACALCKGATPDVEEAILIRSLAVAIHTGFGAARDCVDEQAVVADFETFAAWHAKTGALHTVNFDASRVKSDDGRASYLHSDMVRALRKMLSLSNGSGFSVGVEDWPRNREQLETAAELQAYPHFGILIDLGHMNMRIRSEGDDSAFPAKAAQSYLDAVVLPVNELHVHNNNGLRDLHAPPMTGTADLSAVGGMLRRKGVECISTIEIVPAWCGLTEDEGWQAAAESLELWRSVF